jgi:hypothetical protein
VQNGLHLSHHWRHVFDFGAVLRCKYSPDHYLLFQSTADRRNWYVNVDFHLCLSSRSQAADSSNTSAISAATTQQKNNPLGIGLGSGFGGLLVLIIIGTIIFCCCCAASRSHLSGPAQRPPKESSKERYRRTREEGWAAQERAYRENENNMLARQQGN